MYFSLLPFRIPSYIVKAGALCLVLLSLWANLPANAQEVVEKPEPGFLPKTVSTSRQFIVYHEDPQLRSAIARSAEKMKQRWLEMMNLRDQWKLPIAIHLSRPKTQTAVGEYAILKVYQTEVGIHFEISAVINDSFSGDLFADQLISALFLEYAYRDMPSLEAGKQMIKLPDWLISGTSNYIRQNTSDIPPDLFDSLIRTGQLMTLRQFLNTKLTDPMDATSRKVYGSYAGSFVDMLRNLPGGKSGMQYLVREMSNDAVLTPDNFFKYFPGIDHDTNSLEKWWTINLAKKSTIGNFRMLNAKETEDRLAEYLLVDVPEGDGEHVLEYKLDEWRQFYELPSAKLGLIITAEKLAHLSVVCSPLYSPIVNDYMAILEEIANAKPKKLQNGELDAKLVKLNEERPMMLAKATEITDYMNWFEASQVPDISGAFDEYLRISRSPLPIYQMRQDRVTSYLNSVEYRLAIERQREEQRPTQQTDPVLRQDKRFQENAPLQSEPGTQQRVGM